MFKINYNYLYRFNSYSYGYTYKIINGVYLRFNKYFEYIGLETYYNISPRSYFKLEYSSLEKLLKMGWINEE